MRILIACEESQAVCKAFRAKGHEAYSCDVLPCSGGRPEWHIQQPLETVIISRKWDMIIAFPPCTYICSSGLHWNKRVPGRDIETDKALAFVCMILNADCDRIAVENPTGCIGTRIAWVPELGEYVVLKRSNPKRGYKPAQYVQPYDFGHDASKKTGLWLKGLPVLAATKRVKGRRVRHGGKVVERWANQTDSGQNVLGPSDSRAMDRSKTYLGIAAAMADQWG